MEQPMDCSRAREGLWPPERPRLAGPETLAARAHLDACAACRDYLAQDRLLLDAYERLREVEAPPGTREEVFVALAKARVGGSGEAASPRRERPFQERWSPGALTRILPGVGAVAVVALLVAFFAGGLQGPEGTGTEPSALAPAELPAGTSAGAVFVEDYLRRAVGEEHIETDDPSEIRAFLLRELGVPVVPLQMAELSLERAEICLLKGRRGAMIVYKRRGVAVSHYLVPREGAPVRKPSVSQGQVAGEPPVVTWSSGSLEQALVGEVPSADLLEMAGSGDSS